MIPDIGRFIESRRYVEAMYFGALSLAKKPTAELYLSLGIACCGAIRPIAEIERMLSGETVDSELSNNLPVGRDTYLVYEGLGHFVMAVKGSPEIQIPESIHHVVSDIMIDLGDYLRQEFHGFQSKYRKHSLRTTGAAAAIMLTRLTGMDNELPDTLGDGLKRSAEALLDELFMESEGDASFYDILS